MGGFSTRHAVAAWARAYPLAPRYRTGEPLTLQASDGVTLGGWWLPGPAAAPAAVVLAHGVLHHARHPRILTFAERLARRVPVLALNLRGHGGSGGRTSLGAQEALDVGAGVAEATKRTGLEVVSVGVSLGGASALLQAGREGGVAGVVAVSAPAFTDWSRPGAARLQRFAGSSAGRVVAATILGTRIAPAFGRVEGADSAVAAIAPAWIVLVHDPFDHYFGPEHPALISSWAAGPVETWWEPGAGHGTDLLDAGLATRLADVLDERCR